jgi:hypothetical protein
MVEVGHCRSQQCLERLCRSQRGRPVPRPLCGDGIDWAHFDTFAWRPAAKPGRPKGGEALGLRAAWAMLQARFG